jgi:hypothetical protein
MKIPKRITVGKKKYDVVVCDRGPVKGVMGGVSYDNKLVTVGTRSWYSNKRFKQETIIDTFGMRSPTPYCRTWGTSLKLTRSLSQRLPTV